MRTDFPQSLQLLRAAPLHPNGRGQSENWHKGLKLDMGMEQMPCGQREANALYFAIGVLAYNLAQLLKRQVLPESSTKQVQLGRSERFFQ